MGEQNLGGVTDHIKAITLLPFPHQRKVCTEGLLGRHALCMLGRTLLTIDNRVHKPIQTVATASTLAICVIL